MTSTFRLSVLVFGPHREALGRSVVEVECVPGGTVGDLRVALARHSVPGADLGVAAVAVNRRYQPDVAPVSPGDEVAIIPPVAGG